MKRKCYEALQIGIVPCSYLGSIMFVIYIFIAVERVVCAPAIVVYLVVSVLATIDVQALQGIYWYPIIS